QGSESGCRERGGRGCSDARDGEQLLAARAEPEQPGGRRRSDLVELRPLRVGLVDRDSDIGPALDRETARLLAAGSAPASTSAGNRLRESLAGDAAAAAAELLLRAFDGFRAELLGLLLALVLGRFRQPPNKIGAFRRSEGAGRAQRSRGE